MTDPYRLPRTALLGGRRYDLHADFRDILEIFGYLCEEALPEFLRWEIALGLFYEQPVEEAAHAEAIAYLREFLTAGQPEDRPGPKLLDWQHDAPLILADINKVAGQEVRALEFVNWWTFLSWFHGIGQGQLATVVSIRQKLRQGKKLEAWERDFYRENRARIDLPKQYSPAEQAQREKLEKLLGQ